MKKKLKSNKNIIFPVSVPYITPKDIKNVNKSLKSGWISSDGPEVKNFENKFAKYVDRKFSVAVSSGTAALEIAVKALGIKKNDEVLIPNFTIISNALAVIKQQAKPVLIDCNIENWNIKIDDIAFAAGLSSYYLIHAFRKEFGMTPHAYQLARRINKAKTLLRYGTDIASVAVDLGFTDQSHFHRNFKQIVAATPKQYKDCFA